MSITDPRAVGQIGALVRGCLPEGPLRQPVIVCIGTDRSTGDALGPLVGSQLERDLGGIAPVYGTLDEPVHASNLEECLARIRRRSEPTALIAVDACLGNLESVGTVTVGRGALRPGAGVNKNLPPVGDLYLTGVVNVGGFMEYFVLQNTRLSLVVRMARVIAEGITVGLRLRAGELEAAATRGSPRL
ncbi:MAG: spore protease YyaC [Chloroflexota bacterium]